MKGEAAVSESITLTITADELAELGALLDRLHAEFEQDRGEHERVMACVDKHLGETRQLPALARANLTRRWSLESDPQLLQERQTTERELFWLQVENSILRAQCGLPPREAKTPPGEAEE